MAFADDAFTATPTILVVDDDRMLTTLFTRLLASTGTVITANSGAGGLELARKEVPDLILLDVQMPGQDGFDTISELKNDPTVRHIPVIFITADTLPEIESHCLEAGAADYIAKPVNPRVLQARARTHLLIKQQADMLADLAFRDSLTGALNRGAFAERLDSECRRAAWKGRPISLILIDVDHFAAYNRIYGHLAGDDVLAGIVEVVQGVVEHPGEVVGRLGGDELAVLLPETQAAQAMEVAGLICSAVRDRGTRHSGSPAGEAVTVSVGVAGGYATASAQEITASADAALARARQAGGNRVIGPQ